MSNTLYDLRRLIRQLSADELVIATAYVRNIISVRAKADEVKAWNEFAAKVNSRINHEPEALRNHRMHPALGAPYKLENWVDNVSAFTPKPKTGIEIAMDLED